MEPFSLSPMALGATGAALRRAARPPEKTVEFPAPHLDAALRSSILAALGRCRLVPRRLVAPGHGTLALSLARFVALHGLQLSTRTSLAALFDAEGEDEATVTCALKRQRADFVLSDADGLPLCGIETAGRRAERRDRVRCKAFARAGLPLVVLDAQADWHRSQALLCRALGLTPEVAIQSSTKDADAGDAPPTAQDLSPRP